MFLLSILIENRLEYKNRLNRIFENFNLYVDHAGISSKKCRKGKLV